MKTIASIALLAVGVLEASAINYGDLGVEAAAKRWNASVDLRGFFDDNYNSAPDGTSSKRSSPGFSMGSGVIFNLPGSRTHFSSHLNYAMLYYQDRVINKVDQNVDLGLKLNHKFTERYTLRINDQFNYSSEPELVDLNGPVTAQIRGKSDGMRNQLPISLNLQMTRVFGLEVGYQNVWYKYVETGIGSYSALLDRFEQDFRFDARWQLSPTTGALVGYTYGLIHYVSPDPIRVVLTPQGLAVLNADSRDAAAHQFYVGGEHSFTSTLKLSTSVGVNRTEYINANSASLSPSLNLVLNYAYLPGSSLQWGLNQSRNATDNVGSGTDTESIAFDQDTTYVYAALSHRLTAKLTGGLNLSLQHSVYNGGQTLDGTADDFLALTLSLVYRFNRNWSADVQYLHSELISDDTLRSYSRNRFSTGVRLLY